MTDYEPKPAQTPFRELAPSAKVSCLVGAVIAATLVVGVLAIIAGLLWRAIWAVWGLG